MSLLLPGSVNEFLEETQEWLELAEARNSLMLGAALSLRKQKPTSAFEPFTSERFMALAREGDGVSVAALMTPPYPIILASSNEVSHEAIRSVAEHLRSQGWSVSGVVAVPELAAAFAQEWTRASGHQVRGSIWQRIYSLESPVELSVPAGRLRPATEDDVDTVASWMKGFEREALHESDHERVAHLAVSRIAAREMYLWEDTEPRCMVGRSRSTRHTVTVNAVYTPPQWRREGHATAAVSTLSRLLLSEGFAACVLYADLANPTSNSMYQRIGYRPVSDSAHLTFEQSRSIERERGTEWGRWR